MSLSSAAPLRHLRKVLAGALLGAVLAAGAIPGLSVLPASAAETAVFAAASLKTALDQIKAAYERETGAKVTVSYAGSSALARQIEQGAPAGIFISASTDWMDKLETAGLVRPDSRVDLLGNTLVLVAHGKDAPRIEVTGALDLSALVGDGKLAMALVDSVPAGVYGKSALTALGLWPSIEDKVAQFDNVRAALAIVALGEASHGIVYATDAAAENNVSVVGTFPAGSHAPIVYPAALTVDADAAAAAFLRYLAGRTARAAFEQNGFTVLAK